MTIQLDTRVPGVRPRAQRETARASGLVAQLTARAAEARERYYAECLTDDRARGRHAGRWIAYKAAAALARRYAAETRCWLLLAFVGGLLLGWAQHLWWVRLVTR